MREKAAILHKYISGPEDDSIYYMAGGVEVVVTTVCTEQTWIDWGWNMDSEWRNDNFYVQFMWSKFLCPLPFVSQWFLVRPPPTQPRPNIKLYQTWRPDQRFDILVSNPPSTLLSLRGVWSAGLHKLQIVTSSHNSFFRPHFQYSMQSMGSWSYLQGDPAVAFKILLNLLRVALRAGSGH